MGRLDAFRAGFEQARADLGDGETISFSVADEAINLAAKGKEYTIVLQGLYPGEFLVFGDAQSDDEEGDNVLSGTVADVVRVLLSRSRVEAVPPCCSNGTIDLEEYMVETACFDNLMAQIQDVRRVHGERCAQAVVAGDTCMLVLRLLDPTAGGCVSGVTASAWGIDLSRPISIRMRFNASEFSASRAVPSVQFDQQTSGDGDTALATCADKGGADDAAAVPGFAPAVHLCAVMGHVLGPAWRQLVGGAARCSPDADGAAADSALPKGGWRSSPCESRGSACPLTEHVAAARRRKDEWLLDAMAQGGGFAAQLLRYLYLRMPSLHEYCAICDEPHTSVPMIQRMVCSRDLCGWQLAQFGERITDASFQNCPAEVIDLFVCVAIRAARSERRDKIFDPFPILFAPGSPTAALCHETPNKFEEVSKVMHALCKVREYAGLADTCWIHNDMHPYWGKNELMRPMVQWIQQSIRCHVTPVPAKLRLPSFGTEWQYMLASVSPEREEQFQKLKRLHGARLAFHGSPPENWHSILRHGLKNASHTPLMSNGAKHGTGIYLSPTSATSSSYSRCRVKGGGNLAEQFASVVDSCGDGDGVNRGNRKLDVKRLHIMALCEVVDDPSTLSMPDPYIWLARKEETVVTRFLLAYCSSDVPDIDLSDGSLQAALRKCMAALGSSGAGSDPAC